MPVPESKTCSKCGTEKPLSDYYREAACRDGYRPDCKVCRRAAVTSNRAATVEAKRAYDRLRYEDPTRRAEVIARARAHYVDNHEHHLANRQAYYETHREAWGSYRARRRAREMSVPHEDYTRRQIYDRDGGHCKGCGCALRFEKNGFHIDHIVPISLGGPDTPTNVQLMCPTCNRRKWTTLEGQIHFAV